MLSKRNLVITLGVLTVVGSMLMVLSSNMFFDDIFNIAVGLTRSTVFATLPAVFLTMDFAAAIFYLLRLYKRPKNFKALSKLYLIIIAAMNGLGFISAILAGAVTYHTFVGANPFKGYVIIFMILNFLVAAAAGCGLFFLRKVKDDEEKFKVNFKHVAKTVGWFMFLMVIFNRFGMFMVSPVYIYWRNFALTFPFYLTMLLPLYLGVIKVLVDLEILKCRKLKIGLAIGGLACTVVLYAYVGIVGILESAFISAISPAMPLDRMASKPIEFGIQLAALIAVGVILLVKFIKFKEEPKPEEAK